MLVGEIWIDNWLSGRRKQLGLLGISVLNIGETKKKKKSNRKGVNEIYNKKNFFFLF